MTRRSEPIAEAGVPPAGSDLTRLIDEIRSALGSAGEERWVQSLDDALGVSTLSGEILGELRLRLERLRESGLPGKLNIDSCVDGAIGEIGRRIGR